MGAEQSSMYAEQRPVQTVSTKPNKIKKNHSFHNKSSSLVDLIVNRDWQKLIIATTTHQKEIFVTHKVRLFGVDRKVLPLHLACAMCPPVEAIEALLRCDKSFFTVRTPMKNHKKKGNRVSHSNIHNHAAPIPIPPTRQESYRTSQTSQHSSSEKEDSHDSPPIALTPTTEPLSSFDASCDGSDSDSLSVPAISAETSGNVFFSEKKRDFALQLTPSGDIRQISSSGQYCMYPSDSAESPFVYVTQSEEEKTNYQSRLADDFLPLHIACLFKASPAVIDLLIKAYPEGVEKKNKWGMLPIHIICANLAMEPPKIAAKKAVDDFTARRHLNNLYADTISERNDVWGIESIIELLVDAFPPSLNTSSDNIEWLTPIEYLGRNFPFGHEREHLLNLLKNKRLCKAQDDHTQVSSTDSSVSNDTKAFVGTHKPLLYSYLKMKDWENANIQASRVPHEASCWVLDKDYDPVEPHLPIHLACSSSAPHYVIRNLIHAYPHGIMTKEKFGCYPLHIACKTSLCHESIVDIIECYSDAASIKDEFGGLPLHLACKNGSSLMVIKTLIETYPESCAIKDYNGHTALTYLYTNNECDDPIKNEIIQLFDEYDNGGCGVTQSGSSIG
mmetsp:Transcript_17128/g.20907  ORF Transcript_17128/g.20907 Transcript_17128/m.20907 type:complete len:616 (-) Transcript_17128:217-2064(-)